MNKLNFFNPFVIVVIVLFVGAVAVGAYFDFPVYNKLSDNKKSIEAKSQELQREKKVSENLNQAKAILDNYREAIQAIDSALPNEASVLDLLNFLTLATSQTGMSLDSLGSFNVVPSKDFLGLQEIEVQIGISGPYAAFKNFLRAMEESARLIKIENISFTTSKELKSIDFGLSLKVYSY